MARVAVSWLLSAGSGNTCGAASSGQQQGLGVTFDRGRLRHARVRVRPFHSNLLDEDAPMTAADLQQPLAEESIQVQGTRIVQ